MNYVVRMLTCMALNMTETTRWKLFGTHLMITWMFSLTMKSVHHIFKWVSILELPLKVVIPSGGSQRVPEK